MPKLETLIKEDSDRIYTSDFAVQAFTSSNNLQVFEGELYPYDIDSINKKRLNQDAFSNFIALQLISPESEMLEKLATLDQLQLRYLYLWDSYRLFKFRQQESQQDIDENRAAFHCVLSKQNQLEVLVSLWDVDVNRNTIKLMTKKQQNLKNALVSFSFTSVENEGSESTEGRGSSDVHDALISFEEMLLIRDPSRDLSDFCAFSKR